MLKTVKLLGELGRRFGREYKLDINTPSEALRLLGCQIDGFYQYLIDSESIGLVWRVVAGSPAGLDSEQLDHRMRSDVLVIAPIAQGNGGFGRVLLGVALVGVALAVPFGAVGGGTMLGVLGASLILGGLSQMLSPKPKGNDTRDDGSFLIDSAGGTNQQGQAMPLLLGSKFITNLPVLSAQLDVNEKFIVPPEPIRPANWQTLQA